MTDLLPSEPKIHLFSRNEVWRDPYMGPSIRLLYMHEGWKQEAEVLDEFSLCMEFEGMLIATARMRNIYLRPLNGARGPLYFNSMSHLVVAPEFRRLGYGKKMIRAACRAQATKAWGTLIFPPYQLCTDLFKSCGFRRMLCFSSGPGRYPVPNAYGRNQTPSGLYLMDYPQVMYHTDDLGKEWE